jgi:hypothetical protein
VLWLDRSETPFRFLAVLIEEDANVTKQTDGRRFVVGDSALQKSHMPKTVPGVEVAHGVNLGTNEFKFQGSHQPKTVPLESKNAAPPSKND